MGQRTTAYDFSHAPTNINDILIEIDAQYGLGLRNFITLKLGPNEVDDIYQRVLIRVGTNFHKYNPERAPFKSWIYTITANMIKNEFRNRSRRPQIISLSEPLGTDNNTTLEDLLEFPPDNSTNPDEVDAFFDEKTAHLPLEQRRVLYLQLLKGRNYNEMEHELGVKPGTIKSRRNRGMETAFPEELEGKRHRMF